MKKVKVMVSGIFILFSVGIFAQAATDKLPSSAQDFIKQHFSSASVEEVKENSSWKIWEDEKYEVRFSNGIELDFDKNGNILEIDTQNDQAIPEAVLPSNIVSYLQSNYPDEQIVGWDKKDDGQGVELMNGIEVEFDENGNFLKID